MTPLQRKIAEAAVMAPAAPNVLQLVQNVAESAGEDATTVQSILDELVSGNVIVFKSNGGDEIGRGEFGSMEFGGGRSASVSYEKGPAWTIKD
jgi:hypothetical protein